MENEFEVHDDKKWERRREKQKRFYEKWEEKRKHKMKYAFMSGSLGWGTLTYFLIFLFDSFYEHQNFSLYTIVFSWLLFLFAGYFWGLWMYGQIENRYKEYLSREKEDLEE